MDKTYQGAQARTAIFIRAPRQNSQNVSGMFILYDATGKEIYTGAALMDGHIHCGVPLEQFITTSPDLGLEALERSSKVEFFLQGDFEKDPR